MSSMPQTRAPVGTAGLDDVECSQDYCERTLSVAIVEAGGELRALCRCCRKDLWGCSS
jgi:hypothetical protein